MIMFGWTCSAWRCEGLHYSSQCRTCSAADVCEAGQPSLSSVPGECYNNAAPALGL